MLNHVGSVADDAALAGELRRLGSTSRAFLATDHEPMRLEVRKALGDR
jgi:hypothetical protein